MILYKGTAEEIRELTALDTIMIPRDVMKYLGVWVDAACYKEVEIRLEIE